MKYYLYHYNSLTHITFGGYNPCIRHRQVKDLQMIEVLLLTVIRKGHTHVSTSPILLISPSPILRLLVTTPAILYLNMIL